MMSTDRDVRDAILLLVDACNNYQKRNLALTSAFRSLQLSDNLSECDIQAEALKAYNNADAAVEAQAKEIKSVLQGSGPFLEVLTKFATQHYTEFE
ncbi:MAG: hypothetical protein WAK20_01470 [Candidatus Acidiferrum sp.]